MGTDQEFYAIANEIITEEAENLLDRQLARARTWRAERLANGETADLGDLITKVLSEPNKRGPVLAAYAAAMHRLLGLEDRQ
jgi:hypothetical protein